ncbi:hypothetical protein QZQ21_10100 [Serratia marcescens]|uniref:hypothetical protein n=1 Tax=Serratia marcescens TaxID=615 RepID=UPI00274DB9D6|nr:hypothetical protein [Serratia marcescens]MDP8753871.1 hypothetical protein [Serratia marcescens]MDP8758532.1 hypothetical protein [Serratia marcescens]MDP8768273.1 hypothetical protein [Serratia marcescens]MDP8878377.1 hypothetical protein [Serratia marcescens]
MQTTTQRCEHCGQMRDVEKKAVSIQRYEDGKYKSVRILVCSDTCAPVYVVRQNIRTLQRRLHTQQRRPTW